ncbi:MAG: PBSX family phage terminase large subunit [Eubacteriales bacterium]|nr:PBSX family phage terminase large subunit [Eubacteriales bacterium]
MKVYHFAAVRACTALHKKGALLINITINDDVIIPKLKPLLYDDDSGYFVCFGGRASGKSHSIARALVIKLLQSERRLLVIRKTAASLRDSCFDLFVNIIHEWEIAGLAKIKESYLKIEFANGSSILFKGLDDEAKIRSINGIDYVWFEEATQCTAEEVRQVELSVRSKYKKIYYSFNPVSKVNWVYGKWFADGAVIPAGTRIIKTTWRDNPYLPSHFAADMEHLKIVKPIQYQIDSEGEFASLEKLIFTNWKIENFDFHNLIRQNIHFVAVNGLDFGFSNDPTAIIACLVNKNTKSLYIYKEIYKKGLTNDKIAELIKYAGLDRFPTICDSAEPKSIAELKINGIYSAKPAKKGKGSIAAGIDYLSQYEIIVHPDCENTIIELSNYSWKKDRQSGEYINQPIDEFNHLMDALRYALSSLNDKNKLKTLNKSLFGL